MNTPRPNLSPADLELGIHAALLAHDVEAAVALLKLMVPKDPRRAAGLYDLLCIAIEVGRAEERQPVVLAESADGDLLADPQSGSVIMPNHW